MIDSMPVQRMILVALWLSGIVVDSAAAQVIQGSVVDHDTGRSLTATVRLTAGERHQKSVVIGTEPTGTFMSRVSPGPLTLLVWAAGYSPQPVTITGRLPMPIVVRLVRAAIVEGTLVDEAGSLVGEATVSLKPLSPGGSPFGIEASVRDGHFELRGVAANTAYEISARSPVCSRRAVGLLKVSPGEHRRDVVLRLVGCTQ